LLTVGVVLVHGWICLELARREDMVIEVMGLVMTVRIEMLIFVS